MATKTAAEIAKIAFEAARAYNAGATAYDDLEAGEKTALATAVGTINTTRTMVAGVYTEDDASDRIFAAVALVVIQTLGVTSSACYPQGERFI